MFFFILIVKTNSFSKNEGYYFLTVVPSQATSAVYVVLSMFCKPHGFKSFKIVVKFSRKKVEIIY